jgi:hypothetical protein
MLDTLIQSLSGPNYKNMGTGYGLHADFALSTAIWSFIQFLLFLWPNLSSYNMKRNTELDFRNRMVSFIHGTVCLLLSSYHVYHAPTECGEETNALEYFVLVMSGGYFSYDFLSMAYFKLLDLDMAVHHMLCIGGILQVLLRNVGTGFVVGGLFVAEVSNPAMHSRIMLRNLGKRYTYAYEIAEYTYFMMFFFGRVIMGHPMVWSTVSC